MLQVANVEMVAHSSDYDALRIPSCKESEKYVFALLRMITWQLFTETRL